MVNEHGRGTRIFFSFMVFVMVVGYPLMLLTGLPSFQSLFLGQQTAQTATQENINDAVEKLDKNDCTAGKPPKGKRLANCKEAYESLGAGYQALAIPDEEQQLEGKTPALSQESQNKSLDAFRRLVALDPKDAESQQLLASSYSNQGKSDQALEIYKALVAEDKSNADLVFALASAAQSAGETDLAKANYKKFLKLAPEDERAESATEAIKQIDNPEAAGGGLGGLNIG